MPHQHRRQDDPEAVTPPAPMTVEQLDWITEQVERAADKAVDRAEEMDKHRANHRTIGFAVLFIAFLLNSFWINHVSSTGREQVVKSGDIVAVAGCNRDYEDRIAVRGVLIESKGFTQQAFERGAIDQGELQLRMDFYNERLRELPLPDCRVADDVLTDDPAKPLVVPEALYPGNTDEIVPPVSSQGAEKP